MKKLYQNTNCKLWQKTRNKKIELNKRKRRFLLYPQLRVAIFKNTGDVEDELVVPAPFDFRLIDNPELCLSFFRKIRSSEYLSYKGKVGQQVNVSLAGVEKIDYATISVLIAISDNLKIRNILLHGDFPKNDDCRKFLIESGFLNHMFSGTNKRFPKQTTHSDFIFFEKGEGVLSYNENKKISILVQNVIKHLTGTSNFCQPVKTIILEICGNSIEWGGIQNKQWLFGVKYEQDLVVFTVTDVGKGILETLFRKIRLKAIDFVSGKLDHEILIGAFNQKYGSNTQEENRNKGLPSIRTKFEQGVIKDLKVLTNNALLHFDDVSRSKTFDKGSARFKGTFYQWTMTKECINNLNFEQ